jgi:hypothetical protein
MPDNQVMPDADRYLFQRLHEHARTLERIVAEHPEHPERLQLEAAITDLSAVLARPIVATAGIRRINTEPRPIGVPAAAGGYTGECLASKTAF